MLSGVCKHISFALFLLLSVSSLAAAEGQKFLTHPAKGFEFVGYWRILLIPNEKHGSPIKNEETGFADPCQFLIHQANGDWENITISNLAGREESLRKCPTRKSEVDASLFFSRQKQKWIKSPAQDGLFLITDAKSKVSLFWKVDYVEEDFPTAARYGFDLKRGDLVMQITKKLEGNNIVPIWPMILRPVP